MCLCADAQQWNGVRGNICLHCTVITSRLKVQSQTRHKKNVTPAHVQVMHCFVEALGA